jgi:NAD(P)-dependent dehydrogenase (short-subunit alcohol dehydrogenase family)
MAARELGGDGIRVNSVSPGCVWGPGFATLGATAASLAAEQLVDSPVLPDDVAQAMIWLAGDTCRQATGTDLLIDGGMLAKGSDFNERVILAGIAALTG